MAGRTVQGVRIDYLKISFLLTPIWFQVVSWSITSIESRTPGRNMN